MKELLKLIEKNARYEVKDLADLLGEEESEVRGKIEAAEKQGVIAGYHTIINWERSDVEIT